MGVPSLFRTLVDKFENIHYAHNNDTVDHLYLDYNCLIHYCKSQFTPSDDSSQRDVEEELITEIIRYTSYIICNVVKPKKLAFISIDGQVPMGKIIKQRARRYKKVQDDAYRKKIYEKYNVPLKEQFNSNKITPGTQFMFKLGCRLRSFSKLGAFNKHTKKCFKIFISDANVPGEGEQKIMDFFKAGESKSNGQYPNTVIYGLDADLIILSMLLKRENVKLLREVHNTSTELNKHVDTDFVYFDIDKCCDGLINEFNLAAYERSKIIDDISFITMFGGNDFVEPFVHTKMKDSGLEKILKVYSQVIAELNAHIINKDMINFQFLKLWLSKIVEIEDFCVRKLQTKGNFTQKPENKTPENKTPENMISYEISLYEHSLYKDKCNPFHYYYISDFNKIDFRQENSIWKNEYNTYFFPDNELSTVCENYIAGLKWTWSYYNNNCLSWYWYYKFANAPLSSDFYNYISSKGNDSLEEEWDSIVFPESEPLTPFEQLLMVTPIQHNSILPYCLSLFVREYGSEFEELFPKKFKLDAVRGMKNIYSDPILPSVNLYKISSIVKNCYYSDPEIARNSVNQKLFCHKID